MTKEETSFIKWLDQEIPNKVPFEVGGMWIFVDHVHQEKFHLDLQFTTGAAMSWDRWEDSGERWYPDSSTTYEFTPKSGDAIPQDYSETDSCRLLEASERVFLLLDRYFKTGSQRHVMNEMNGVAVIYPEIFFKNIRLCDCDAREIFRKTRDVQKQFLKKLLESGIVPPE